MTTLSTHQTSGTLDSQLKAIVGAEHLLSAAPDLEIVSRTNVPDRNIPQFAVYPGTAEEVAEIFKLANDHKVPVWPVSQGKNWGYGSKSACYPGGITMILSRMNRIHEVNEDLCYAVIEPGVTYGQLNDHLKANHPSLWADSSGSTKDASVVGNALDRGRGVTPYADHFGALCGMEVVLPNGELLRTGTGPSETFPAWNVYKWGTGPYIDGLFSQSNLGTVVKSGIWLMPAPEKYDFFVFEYTADSSRFAEFLDTFRKLIFQGAIKSYPHLANDFAMLCIVDQYPNDLLHPGQRHLSSDAMAEWKKRLGVSDWTFGCGMYGSKQEVKLHKKIAKKELGKFGEVVFVGGCEKDTRKGRLMLKAARMALRLKGKTVKLLEGLPYAIRLFQGIPTDYFCRQVYFKSHAEKPAMGDVEPARDGCGFVWIGPVVPFTSEHLIGFLDEVRPLYDLYEFDFFVELIIESPRSVICLLGFFYDKQDEKESERATQLYNALRELSHERGYPPYRASSVSSPKALDCNPTLKSTLHDIKRAVDPNNILAPGRYGVDLTSK
ncbi:FAD-binding oxidoreductase [Stieleria sp. ICT_E10.1]|uniref:FAD-binding oxidoreductase n=1 Tax=Stieleria sedimenti TaxID=2976331 RepID=UPI00217FA9E2|nr:FAD-binding oxidoreductase [Stieleria sedimenti]MCS7470827.1 FAD-binding oxidoreductase [Stieleria sedimenti]